MGKVPVPGLGAGNTGVSLGESFLFPTSYLPEGKPQTTVLRDLPVWFG